jgi:plastocyanin
MFSNSLCNRQRQRKRALPVKKHRSHKDNSVRVAPVLLLVAAIAAHASSARADDTVTLSIVMKDHQFDPAELHAPAGKPIAIHVKNLNSIVTEFESSELHFEKIVPPGNEGVVYVRPQQPGRYNFLDDFHHETRGVLVVQ